jgi:hypothetical protein
VSRCSSAAVASSQTRREPSARGPYFGQRAPLCITAEYARSPTLPALSFQPPVTAAQRARHGGQRRPGCLATTARAGRHCRIEYRSARSGRPSALPGTGEVVRHPPRSWDAAVPVDDPFRSNHERVGGVVRPALRAGRVGHVWCRWGRCRGRPVLGRRRGCEPVAIYAS